MSFEEVGGRPRERLPLKGDVDLLVVEGEQAGDGEELSGGEVVAPGHVVPRVRLPESIQ